MQFIIPAVKQILLETVYGTIKKYPTLHIFTINTNRDHVHIHIEIPPNLPISSVVQKLKATSSLYLRKRFKFIKERYLEKEGIWSDWLYWQGWSHYGPIEWGLEVNNVKIAFNGSGFDKFFFWGDLLLECTALNPPSALLFPPEHPDYARRDEIWQEQTRLFSIRNQKTDSGKNVMEVMPKLKWAVDITNEIWPGFLDNGDRAKNRWHDSWCQTTAEQIKDKFNLS